MANLQAYHHFKLDLKKWTNIQEASWLIHGTKRRTDDQLQSLELPCRKLIYTGQWKLGKHWRFHLLFI